jgi:hypothetical protein
VSRFSPGFIFPGVGTLGTLTFLGATALSTNSNPATCNNPATVGFGTTDANRWIIVALAGGTADRTISSVTIGGVAATIVLQSNGNGTARPSAICVAKVPTNANQDIVITASGTDQWQAHIYNVVGNLNTTPIDSFQKIPGSGAATFSLNTQAGGFIVGIAAGVTTANTYWSGDVTRDNGTASPGGTSGHNTSALTGAAVTNIVTQTNGSITTTTCVSMGSL